MVAGQKPQQKKSSSAVWKTAGKGGGSLPVLIQEAQPFRQHQSQGQRKSHGEHQGFGAPALFPIRLAREPQPTDKIVNQLPQKLTGEAAIHMVVRAKVSSAISRERAAV
jgi:hypothetical protein